MSNFAVMGIYVENLTKTYAAQKAVDSVTFSAEPGRVTGFLGPNGAGKSTTMRMITGYLKPDDGVVKVDGVDLSVHPLRARNRAGYLPENNPLYLHMYVREYLNFMADLYQVKGKKRKISELIGQTGLQAESHKKIGRLSKGYKQRVGLAQALLHDPPVLVLDEPTSGLDPNQLSEIRQLIRELGKEKTVLLSTHILQEVEMLCDQVIIIHQGAIAANDTLQNLLQRENGSLEEIFRKLTKNRNSKIQES